MRAVTATCQQWKKAHRLELERDFRSAADWLAAFLLAVSSSFGKKYSCVMGTTVRGQCSRYREHNEPGCERSAQPGSEALPSSLLQ